MRDLRFTYLNGCLCFPLIFIFDLSFSLSLSPVLLICELVSCLFLDAKNILMRISKNKNKNNYNVNELWTVMYLSGCKFALAFPTSQKAVNEQPNSTRLKFH